MGSKQTRQKGTQENDYYQQQPLMPYSQNYFPQMPIQYPTFQAFPQLTPTPQIQIPPQQFQNFAAQTPLQYLSLRQPIHAPTFNYPIKMQAQQNPNASFGPNSLPYEFGNYGLSYSSSTIPSVSSNNQNSQHRGKRNSNYPLVPH